MPIPLDPPVTTVRPHASSAHVLRLHLYKTKFARGVLFEKLPVLQIKSHFSEITHITHKKAASAKFQCLV